MGTAKIGQYLIPSESHAIEVRHHWASLGASVGTAAAFWVGGLIGIWLSLDAPLLRATCVFFLIFTTGWLAWLIAEWWFERFVVTDKRVLLLTGLLNKRLAVMPLAKVTDLTYERSVMGRLLGYGAFIIESAGQNQALRRIEYIPEPHALYHEVSALLFGGRISDDGTGNDSQTGAAADSRVVVTAAPTSPAQPGDTALTERNLWPAGGGSSQWAEQPTAPLPNAS